MTSKEKTKRDMLNGALSAGFENLLDSVKYEYQANAVYSAIEQLEGANLKTYKRLTNAYYMILRDKIMGGENSGAFASATELIFRTKLSNCDEVARQGKADARIKVRQKDGTIHYAATEIKVREGRLDGVLVNSCKVEYVVYIYDNLKEKKSGLEEDYCCKIMTLADFQNLIKEQKTKAVENKRNCNGTSFRHADDKLFEALAKFTDFEHDKVWEIDEI